MSERLKKIIALCLAFVLASACTVFAANASIISPTASTIISSDNILISVKVADKKTVRISLFEEKIPYTEEDGTAAYRSVDVTNFNVEDLLKIASGRTLDDAGSPILLSTGEAVRSYVDSLHGEAVNFNSPMDIAFYTKQLVGIKPGLYKIAVEEIGEDGTSVEMIQNIFAVKEKPTELKASIFTNPSTGGLNFLQSMIKNLFK